MATATLLEPRVLAHTKRRLFPDTDESNTYAVADTQFATDEWFPGTTIPEEVRSELAPFNHVRVGTGFPDLAGVRVLEPDLLAVERLGDHALVAPDNGVVRPVARTLAREADGTAAVELFRVVERQESAGDDIGWPPAPASSTFHGRDVFAPTAARAHRLAGELDDEPGFEPVETAIDLRFPESEVRQSRAVGEVLVADTFGNAVTNVPGRVARDRFGEAVTVNGDRAPARETYARVEPGERVVTVGSHGNVELAVNQGRGDEAFGLAAGEPVTLSW